MEGKERRNDGFWMREGGRKAGKVGEGSKGGGGKGEGYWRERKGGGTMEGKKEEGKVKDIVKKGGAGEEAGEGVQVLSHYKNM